MQPTSQWIPSAKLENIINELTIEEQTVVCEEEKEENVNINMQSEENADNNINVKHRSVSTIVQELQRELERPSMEVKKVYCKILNIYKFIYYIIYVSCNRTGNLGPIWKVQILIRIANINRNVR